MYAVGVIEVLAGVAVATLPRYGALLVAAWLAGIARPRLRLADHQTGVSGTRKLPDQIRKELTTRHTACADEPSVCGQLIHPDGVR
jgi:hypothetical protein